MKAQPAGPMQTEEGGRPWDPRLLNGLVLRWAQASPGALDPPLTSSPTPRSHPLFWPPSPSFSLREFPTSTQTDCNFIPKVKPPSTPTSLWLQSHFSAPSQQDSLSVVCTAVPNVSPPSPSNPVFPIPKSLLSQLPVTSAWIDGQPSARLLCQRHLSSLPPVSLKHLPPCLQDTPTVQLFLPTPWLLFMTPWLVPNAGSPGAPWLDFFSPYHSLPKWTHQLL